MPTTGLYSEAQRTVNQTAKSLFKVRGSTIFRSRPVNSAVTTPREMDEPSFYTPGDDPNLVTIFGNYRITATAPSAYDVVFEHGSKALPGILQARRQKIQYAGRRTTACVPCSAVLLPINNARSSSSSSIQPSNIRFGEIRSCRTSPRNRSVPLPSRPLFLRKTTSHPSESPKRRGWPRGSGKIQSPPETTFLSPGDLTRIVFFGTSFEILSSTDEHSSRQF